MNNLEQTIEPQYYWMQKFEEQIILEFIWQHIETKRSLRNLMRQYHKSNQKPIENMWEKWDLIEEHCTKDILRT